MSVASFYRGSVLPSLFAAIEEKLCRNRNLPGVHDHGKSVKNILSDNKISAKRSSRKLKSILVASITIMTLSMPGLSDEAQLRTSGERAVKRGLLRGESGSPITRGPVPQTVRVLVDASKDGGIWWFPQYAETGFDPDQQHQGKAMADAMRARGWEVAELPRGEIVTPDTLQGFDILIRPEPYSAYNSSEAIAYRDAVAAGARLYLMGSSAGYDDTVAAAFGLRFGGNRHISLEKVVPHSLTAGIESLAIPWVTVLERPQESEVLAWGENGDPLLGYHCSFAGYVLFAGTSSAIFGDPLRSNVLEFLEWNSAYDLRAQSLAPPIAISAAGPPAPVLINPEPGEVLPQPDAGDWVFEWEEVLGARRYQITVLGPKASLFLVNTETASTSYVIPQSSSYIVNRNAIGWRWSVRAQGQDGEWGDWSEEGLFDVTLGQNGC